MTDTPTPGELPQPPELPELAMQELTMVVPLLEKARDHLREMVTVWIPGGMKVDGRLVDVDEDDATLTVQDKNHDYVVALQSIAVLEVER